MKEKTASGIMSIMGIIIVFLASTVLWFELMTEVLEIRIENRNKTITKLNQELNDVKLKYAKDYKRIEFLERQTRRCLTK